MQNFEVFALVFGRNAIINEFSDETFSLFFVSDGNFSDTRRSLMGIQVMMPKREKKNLIKYFLISSLFVVIQLLTIMTMSVNLQKAVILVSGCWSQSATYLIMQIAS